MFIKCFEYLLNDSVLKLANAHITLFVLLLYFLSLKMPQFAAVHCSFFSFLFLQTNFAFQCIIVTVTNILFCLNKSDILRRFSKNPLYQNERMYFKLA